MPTIKISCPFCSKSKLIEVNDEKIKSSLRGISLIQINHNIICDHSFLIYLDKNCSIRDYLLLDFQVQLPQLDIQLDLDKKVINLLEEFDIFLVTVNFLPKTLIYLLRSFLLKQKVLLINDDEVTNKHLKKFLEFIFKDTFEFELLIINQVEHKQNKKKYNDYLIIENSALFNNKEKNLDLKKLKIETMIIQNFFAESEPKIALLKLKNEILKLFKLSKELIIYINNSKDKKTIGKINLINQLETNNNVKISLYYLDLLIEIIQSYFNHEISKISKYYYPKFFGEDISLK